MTQDFSKRAAIVLRPDGEPWQVMNAACHIAAKLGRVMERFDSGDTFTTRDNFLFPAIHSTQLKSLASGSRKPAGP
jgi:hypothetical protein